MDPYPPSSSSSSAAAFYYPEEEEEEGVPAFWPLSPELPSPPHIVSTSVALAPPPPPPPPPPVLHSAFVQYRKPEERHPIESTCTGGSRGSSSMFRRMVDLQRRIRGRTPCGRADASNRWLSHMISERRRRERQSKGYADLRSLLPPTSKGDKNSIVQTAISYLQMLQGRMDELRRDTQDLSLRMAREANGAGGGKIRLRVVKPSSPIDSMIGTLGLLKGMEVRTRSMQWSFHDRELRAEMDVVSKIGAADMESAVESVLEQVEKFCDP